MVSNKRSIIAITVMTICFALISCVLIYNIFKPNGSIAVNKASDKEIYVLQDYFGKKYDKDTTIFNVLETEKTPFLIVSTKYDNYYRPCFDFEITQEGIKIIRPLSKDFYLYAFKPGDVITAIDGKSLSNLKYQEIIDLIYAKNYAIKTFTLKDGSSYGYGYHKLDNAIEIIKDEGLKIKIYNLDYVSMSNLYNLCKEYDEVTLDLSEASLGGITSLTNFISLFSHDDDYIFKGIKGSRALKINANIKIITGNTDDALFLASALKKVSSKVSFSEEFISVDSINYTLKVTDTRYSYNLYLYDKKVELL